MPSPLLSLTSSSALPTFFLNSTKFRFPIKTEFPKTFSRPFSLSIQCSTVSVAINASPATSKILSKPSAAEVSRTIMELSSTGTLSAISLQDGWPLGICARFVVDVHGTPALCLNEPGKLFVPSGPSSFNVKLEQSRLKTRQCTLLGNLEKLEDGLLLKKLCTRWEKKFGEDVDEGLLYVIKVDRILQLEDFKEDTLWITSLDYFNAEPDPLRNCAEKIVYEMDTKHAEDVLRVCHVYVDSQFQVTDAKLIWVDRLGLDLYIYSEEGIFTARVPFPREVSDEKGVKSSLNSMFHLAWEVEKGYVVPDFERIKFVKKISSYTHLAMARVEALASTLWFIDYNHGLHNFSSYGLGASKIMSFNFKYSKMVSRFNFEESYGHDFKEGYEVQVQSKAMPHACKSIASKKKSKNKRRRRRGIQFEG